MVDKNLLEILIQFKKGLVGYDYSRTNPLIDRDLMRNSNRLAILVLVEVCKEIEKTVKLYKNHELLEILESILDDLNKKPDMLLLQFVKNPNNFKNRFVNSLNSAHNGSDKYDLNEALSDFERQRGILKKYLENIITDLKNYLSFKSIRKVKIPKVKTSGLYTKQEAAAYTGKSVSWIEKKTSAGELRNVAKLGQHPLYKKKDLDQSLLR